MSAIVCITSDMTALPSAAFCAADWAMASPRDAAASEACMVVASSSSDAAVCCKNEAEVSVRFEKSRFPAAICVAPSATLWLAL